MVFTPTNLFKSITCPYAEQCKLTNCIFSHELSATQTTSREAASASTIQLESESQQPVSLSSTNTTTSPVSHPPPAKRRKIYDNAAEKPPTKADELRSRIAAARNSATTAPPSQRSSHSPPNGLHSATRTVSPPPVSARGQLVKKNQRDDSRPPASVIVESLNPRLIPQDPVGHNKRSLYLQHLHAEMERLNQQLQSSALTDSQNRPFVLSGGELVKAALEEEEAIARAQSAVYANVIKQHIAAYKKLPLDDWLTKVKTTFLKAPPPSVSTNSTNKPFVPTLSLQQELAALPDLLANQATLRNHGYIPVPPAEEAAAEAAAAVEASANYEICDRCSARFQIYPSRNSDGLLASNGPCTHHPNRRVFPPRTKGDVASGAVNEAYFPCCGGKLGSPGCEEKQWHVFKTSSPARLAAAMEFVTTPANASPRLFNGALVQALAIDCEMGYTTLGMEVIRLSAVDWPQGRKVIDVLVRPLGSILDLNSRFSGVWPEEFTSARPFDPDEEAADADAAALRILPSPRAARDLLTSYLTPTTPLIGHAIDNDLNSLRLCHPSIIDTVILFPHPKGLPMRFGLKMLAQRHLGWKIQMGGDSGHDSLEDARATGELVRVRIEKDRVVREGTVGGIVAGMKRKVEVEGGGS